MKLTYVFIHYELIYNLSTNCCEIINVFDPKAWHSLLDIITLYHYKYQNNAQNICIVIWHSTHYSVSESKTIFSEIGLRNTFAVPSFTICTSTLRTFLSLLARVLMTSPMGHSFLFAWASFNRTSPSLTFGLLSVHFVRFCKVDKYSPFHLFQNLSARCWTRFHWFPNNCPEEKFSRWISRYLTFVWVTLLEWVLPDSPGQ